MWSELGTLSGIIVAVVMPAYYIISYLLKYDKHLYCITMQSIDISDIKDKTLSESIGIFLSWNDMKKKIKNLYTTKVKIANAGFSQIKNDTPDENLLTLRFDEESEIIAIKKEKNLKDRGISVESPDKEKNVIKIKYKGFNRKSGMYLEVICVNGMAKPPHFNAPEPLKVDRLGGYEQRKAEEEKSVFRTFLALGIASLIIYMAFFILYALSGLLNRLGGVLIISLMFFLSISIIIWSSRRIRTVNLLTISPPKETELETKLFIERSIRSIK